MHEYTVRNLEDIQNHNLKHSLESIITGSGMYALPYFTHDSFTQMLEEYGFHGVSQEDVSNYILPMSKYFRKLALPVYPIVKMFHHEAKYPNITAGAKGVQLVKRDYLWYMAVRCHKPLE